MSITQPRRRKCRGIKYAGKEAFLPLGRACSLLFSVPYHILSDLLKSTYFKLCAYFIKCDYQLWNTFHFNKSGNKYEFLYTRK